MRTHYDPPQAGRGASAVNPMNYVEMHANRSEASRRPDSLLRTAEICFRSNNFERKSHIIVFVRAIEGTDATKACHHPRHRCHYSGRNDPVSTSVADRPAGHAPSLSTP